MKTINFVAYPAIFHYADDGITVTFPDLEGCITCGHTQEEAFKMAKEALGLHLYDFEENYKPFPKPTAITDIKVDKNEVICLIEVYLNAFRNEFKKSMKKTVTIPRWLNDAAEEKGINFSKVLQNGLKEYLGL